MKQKPKYTEREIAAAYAQDRSEQYSDKSSAKCALEDLAAALRNGEHEEAFKHGELDDLLEWGSRIRRQNKRRKDLAAKPRRSA